jgi:aryl-alcohol dehydrogenase-like predicted oxidoreductase
MTSRREFLRAAGAAAILSPALVRGQSDKLGKLLPQRALGNTGEKITAFGLGGHHVGKARDPKTAEALIERAIERGVRVFDNAVNYQDGLSETYYGKFLCPKYREHVFLTTKSSRTTAKDVRKEFDDSLRRLNTDQLDLWQVHTLQSVDDVKKRIENGVLDVFLEMREKKKTRYIGFTGHTSQEAHVYFLDHCKAKGYRFDTCLMPMNLADPHYDSFIVNVLPKVREQEIALFAMKSLVFGRIFDRAKELDPGVVTVKNLHEYVYSLPVACLLSGCETVEQIDENTAILENFTGMDDPRREQLVAATRAISGPGLEYYKRRI